MRRSFSKSLYILVFSGFLGGTGVQAQPLPDVESFRSGVWKVVRNEWTAQDEQRYSEFVQALGEAKCFKTSDCLMNAANPYRHQNPPDINKAFSDCADLPYVLRAYFAYMNNLPFSYVSGVKPLGNSNDVRYSKDGNYPSARKVVRSGAKLLDVVKEINNAVSSAMFRMAPERDVDEKGNFPDFYSVKLNRLNVRPGTVIYDPNGHVAVVYKVEADGRIRFMDAHPDNSLTRGTFGERFARSRPAAGAGFKNHRPYRLTTDGKLQATRMLPQLSDFGTEQYYGTHPVYKEGSTQPDPTKWNKGRFEFKGKTVGYYDYLRFALAEGELRYYPVEEFNNILDSLCEDSKFRQASIEDGIKSGIHLKDHPNRLPENIYGTHGEWESYSTPSRDARLKTTFREARKRLEQFVEMLSKNDPQLVYAGNVSQMKAELLKIYDAKTSECRLTYTRSNGELVDMSLAQFEQRLFKLSFDPYHCVELRWGASGAELGSCPDSQNKRDWYAAEQRLRNQLDRSYDVRMDFTLEDLKNKVPGSGVDAPPVIQLREFLAN